MQAEPRTRNPAKAVEEAVESMDEEIEVIAVEQPAAERLRIFIDAPGGVDLGLCERVTLSLSELRESFALEVSSPGADRPLTKPEHFRRFAGRVARVKTTEPHGGRRSFTGTIEGADEEGVLLSLDEGSTTIPFDRVARSNLVPEHPEER